MLESKYQAQLIAKLKDILPGCVVIKNDPAYIQGIPDLLVLWEDKWAALEVKRNSSESMQPNQEYYLDMMYTMSYAAVIFPENEERVLHDLQQSFGVG